MDGHEYLFNLAQDERERANLARVHPQRLEELRAQWLAWERGRQKAIEAFSTSGEAKRALQPTTFCRPRS